ncbi:MAG: glycosyl hydrolase [Bacteroidia bacterium]|nr:MAG: glycosyl hydrolase [Bacteroidia bacterium]
MKFLIIRFSSIGDIVLTTPVISAIQQKFPNAQIHFLTKKKFSEVLIHHPKITKIWEYEKNLQNIIQALKKQDFDYVIDLHNSLRSKWVTFQLQKKTLTFQKENWKKWKMVYLKSKIPIAHVVDRYLETLKNLDISPSKPLKLEYYEGKEAENEASHILNQYGIEEPFLAIVLGATHFTKKWLKEYFVDFINELHQTVVLVGGKTEIEESQWIENQIINKKKCLNLCGKTTLNVSAAIIKKSEWVLSHDTGLMHIACAYQKEMIVLWGNTCPELGFSPYQNPNAQNISLDLDCKPCSKLGLSRCPKGHFSCMKNITPSMVLKKFLARKD